MGTRETDGRTLFDNYIKLDWPREVKEAGVTKTDGSAYVPVARNVSLLRKDVNALDEAVRIWREDDAERMSPGYRAIADQVGVAYTWEYRLIEAGRPWAADVPSDVRAWIEKYFGHALEELNMRNAEKRARIETIRREMSAGERPRIKLPGE